MCVENKNTTFKIKALHSLHYTLTSLSLWESNLGMGAGLDVRPPGPEPQTEAGIPDSLLMLNLQSSFSAYCISSNVGSAWRQSLIVLSMAEGPFITAWRGVSCFCRHGNLNEPFPFRAPRSARPQQPPPQAWLQDPDRPSIVSATELKELDNLDTDTDEGWAGQ